MTLRRRQRGMNLIEVMVAVLVLSAGMLGLAGMQLQSLKFSQTSRSAAQANFLAQDILERIRANRGNVANYVITRAAAAPTQTATMAQQDLSSWLSQVGSTLPSGDADVTWVAASRTLTINIYAADQQRVRQAAGGNAAESTYTFVTQLEP